MDADEDEEAIAAIRAGHLEFMHFLSEVWSTAQTSLGEVIAWSRHSQQVEGKFVACCDKFRDHEDGQVK